MASQNLEIIQTWLQKKLDWVKRAQTKEKASGEDTELTLSGLLGKELEKRVNEEEEAYAEALTARTPDDKHAAIIHIIEARQAALLGTKEGVDFDESDLDE